MMSYTSHKKSLWWLFVVWTLSPSIWPILVGNSSRSCRGYDILPWITASLLLRSLMITPDVRLAQRHACPPSPREHGGVGLEQPGNTQGHCTLSHYHASWCVGLDICHQASEALLLIWQTLIVVSWKKRHGSCIGCVTGCLVGHPGPTFHWARLPNSQVQQRLNALVEHMSARTMSVGHNESISLSLCY